MSQQLLVTGASGHLGQSVLNHLLNTLGVNPSHIVATTRKPDSLAAFAAKGVSVRHADFEDEESLNEAFKGVDRLLLVSTDAVDRPGRRLEQHRAALKAAEKAKVKHVIYTSWANADKSVALVAPDHVGTEAALAASSLPSWTVLRNHSYFENLFFSLPAILRNKGQWFHAAGEGKQASISRGDLALAAATVLAGTTEGKHVFTVSGEEALAIAEQAKIIADVLGTTITPISVPVEGLVQGIVGSGLPEPVARILASFDENTAAGFAADISTDFRTITGVAPQHFSAWAVANQAALAGPAA